MISINKRKILVHFLLCGGGILIFLNIFFFVFLFKSSKSIQAYHTLRETHFVAHGRNLTKDSPDNTIGLFKYAYKKGYKIIECDVIFTKDLVPILSHEDSLHLLLPHAGKGDSLNINKLNYDELCNFNLSTRQDTVINIETLESVLEYAKRHNLCVELDLQKHGFGRKQMKILYDLVVSIGMVDKVIWEVSNRDFWYLAIIDRNLTYQIDHTWSYKEIDKWYNRQFLAGTIILSKWFGNFEDIDWGEHKNIIQYAHKRGFIMKCSVVNDSNFAKKMIDCNVDMMTTDILTDRLFDR